MFQEMLAMSNNAGGGTSTLEIEDVTASSRQFTINNGIVVQYTKATGSVRAIGIIENGVGKVVSNMGYGASTAQYANGVLTIGDTIYTSQPSAVAYIIID